MPWKWRTHCIRRYSLRVRAKQTGCRKLSSGLKPSPVSSLCVTVIAQKNINQHSPLPAFVSFSRKRYVRIKTNSNKCCNSSRIRVKYLNGSFLLAHFQECAASPVQFIRSPIQRSTCTLRFYRKSQGETRVCAGTQFLYQNRTLFETFSLL